MKRPIPSGVFYAILAIVLVVVGTMLYKQATEPLYKRDPDEQKFVSPSERMRNNAMQKGGASDKGGKMGASSDTGKKADTDKKAPDADKKAGQ